MPGAARSSIRKPLRPDTRSLPGTAVAGRLAGVTAAGRIVRGTLLGAFSGMLVAVPAVMLANLFLIDDAAFEAGMAVAFLGLMAAGFGLRAGATAGLAIALMLEGHRSGRFGKRALTAGALATVGVWVLQGFWVVQDIPSADYLFVQFFWMVVGIGGLWTVLATLFVRSRARADAPAPSYPHPSA